MIRGRDAELAMLLQMLDGVERAGGALVLRCPPGSGSRFCLTPATQEAAARNMVVLKSSGVQSEAPLRAARETFDASGATGWADRARQELRASGETSRTRAPVSRDRLTAQELQIPQMAATGLTNREIGRQLYLSHRTVGFHLHRVFPKLGVTSRGQLAAALAQETAASR
jgi:DNA-binding NarL/FixJ family response regulator